jgi:hypothetical protein
MSQALARMEERARRLGIPFVLVVFLDRILADAYLRRLLGRDLVAEGYDLQRLRRWIEAKVEGPPIPDTTEVLGGGSEHYRIGDTHLSDFGNLVGGSGSGRGWRRYSSPPKRGVAGEMERRGIDRLPFTKLWLTLGIFALVLLAYLACRALLGDGGALFGPDRDAESVGDFQVHTVIALLISYMLTHLLRARRELEGDLDALRPLLADGAEVSAEEILSSVARLPETIVTIAGGLFGVGILPLFRGGAGFVPDPVGGVFDLLWSAVGNFALFAIMARLAYALISIGRQLDERVTRRIRIDLLDLGPLAPYARRGLRAAMYWLLGSSIASLLFLRFGFLWAHVFILIGTISVGVFVMLQALKGVHGRLEKEKQRELAVLRTAIRSARGQVLDDGTAAADAAVRLPGLLALEARIEAVNTWPFDISTFLRFTALGLLAVGSWLGGAVIERLLGLAVD